ncbi:LPS assembly protein LptD [Reinekea forsetii]|nr:LPS assembly protein LptD [Reinekea forsetii]
MKLLYRVLATAITSYTTVSYAQTVVDLDWVDINQLPEQDSANIAPYCPGGFVSPAWSKADDTKIHYDRAEAKVNGSGVFYGNVTLSAEDVLAQANQLTYNRPNEQATLEGEALIRFDNFALSSDQAQFSTQNSEASANNSIFVIHSNDMRGKADTLGRDDRFTYAQNVALTRCSPSDNAWALQSASLTIDNEMRYAKAWHTQLKVKGVPVFYWPYVSFPLDDQRFTGFLTPTFGFTQGDQFLGELRLPFYMNLAPNYDDTLALHYFGNEGLLFDNEFRFLTPNHNGINDVSILTLPKDLDDSAQQDIQRWQVKHQQSGKLSQNTVYDVTANWVSDVNFEQAFAAETEAKPEQTLTANLTHRSGDFKNTLAIDYKQPVADSAESYRFNKTHALATTQVADWRGKLYYEHHSLFDADARPASAAQTELKRQPEITLEHSARWLDFVNTDTQTRMAYFDRALSNELKSTLDENDVSLNNSTLRSHAQIEFTSPIIENWGYFKPSITGYYTAYNTANDLFDVFPTANAATDKNQTDRTVWRATFDQALTIENPGEKVDTEITPRLHYTYTPFVEQPHDVLEDTEATDYALFQTSRFSSIDRIGDMNRFSSSLTSSFISSENNRTLATLALEKGMKLSQERITLNEAATATNTPIEYSPWTVKADVKPSDALTVSSEWGFAHRSLELKDYNVNLSYQPEGRVFSNLHLTQEGSERELGFATYFPVRQNIALIGYAIVENNEEDFQLDGYKFKEFVYGVDYDSCCWNIRLAGYDTAVDNDQSDTFFPLETNRGVYFEFTLKGLGASFGTIEDFLTNLNIGYTGKMFNYK